jgi:TetR/AcrR family tetracycline transcriptional repressor
MRASRSTKLSASAIVRTAVDIADREGLPAVSMRRIGAEVGHSGMSVYGYVSSKEELLDLMADHVLGEVPEVDVDAPWESAIVEFFVGLHDVLLAHPGVAQAFTLRPTRGPNTQRHGRLALAALTAGGLPGPAAVDAFIALSCYTIGATLYASARTAPNDEADPGWIAFGDTETQAREDLQPLWEDLASRAGPRQFRSGLEHLTRGYASEVTPG